MRVLRQETMVLSCCWNSLLHVHVHTESYDSLDVHAIHTCTYDLIINQDSFCVRNIIKGSI